MLSHADYIDYLNRTFQHWPDMRRYINTARLEDVTCYFDGQPVQREGVTVTLFDKRTDAEQEAQA